MARRKKDAEYRRFQDEWTEEFAFVERAGSAVCLICNNKIASMKRWNVKRHFQTRHATFASKYPAGDSRKKACQELLSRVEANQQQLQGDDNSFIYDRSLPILKDVKPFTDGESAKTFMLDVANELFDDLPDKDKIIKRIQDMPLLASTVHDRATMTNQAEEKQVKGINAAPFFSLALGKSTDVSHWSQLRVIARYAADDTLLEESLGVLPIKESTRGEDLFKSFMEFAQEKHLPMDKLVSVCTDGAPCMVEKNQGFMALLREHKNKPILSFHCILNQETLCAQMCDGQLGEVMSLVIRVINLIVVRAVNDLQFKTLLDEVGHNYHSLFLYSNVRWLSRGKVLSCFAACLNEIRSFLEMKDIEHPELAETEWLLKFYYLVDMTEHLNQFTVKMQGVENTVLSLQQAIFAFKNKLELLIVDLETGRLLHFENLRQFKDACAANEPAQKFDLHQLSGFTSSFLQWFRARFGEFWEHTRLFRFITHPNECSLNTADLSYIPGVSIRDFELEMADLKASDMWVNKFKSLNEDLERIARQKAELESKHMWTEMRKLQPEDQLIIKTWNVLPVSYHTLQRVSIAVLTIKLNMKHNPCSTGSHINEEILANQEFSNQEEPEPLQMKEEPEELFINQEGEQLVLKQESDTFTLTASKEENDLREDQTLFLNSEESLCAALTESVVNMPVIISVVGGINSNVPQDQKGDKHENSGSAESKELTPTINRVRIKMNTNLLC